MDKSEVLKCLSFLKGKEQPYTFNETKDNTTPLEINKQPEVIRYRLVPINNRSGSPFKCNEKIQERGRSNQRGNSIKRYLKRIKISQRGTKEVINKEPSVFMQFLKSNILGENQKKEETVEKEEEKGNVELPAFNFKKSQVKKKEMHEIYLRLTPKGKHYRIIESNFHIKSEITDPQYLQKYFAKLIKDSKKHLEGANTKANSLCHTSFSINNICDNNPSQKNSVVAQNHLQLCYKTANSKQESPSTKPLDISKIPEYVNNSRIFAITYC